MRKLIHHTWKVVENSRLLKHKKCTRCNCEQFYSAGYGRVIFQDRFGKIYYRTPECELTTNINI